MFVLGADSDSKQTVRDTVSFALKHHIDTVMLNILTPLPGTKQFADLDAEGRIFEKRWHLYDAHHVLFTPKQMSPYDLQREVLRGYMRFYSGASGSSTCSRSASPSCSSRPGAGTSSAPGAGTSATRPS